MAEKKYTKRQREVGSNPIEGPLTTGGVRLRAGIDFIKFNVPIADIASSRAIAVWEKLRRVSRLEYNPRRGEATLHEPRVNELAALVYAHPLGGIVELEIYVDHYPRVSPSWADLHKLQAQLRHALLPQRYALLAQAKRYYIDRPNVRPRRDRVGLIAKNATYYYRQRDRYAELKLYAKRHDRGNPEKIPRVRVELRLTRGGCQLAGADRFGKLPHFFSRAMLLGRAFSTARCAKFRPIQTKAKTPTELARVRDLNERGATKLGRLFRDQGAYGVWVKRKELDPSSETAPLVPDSRHNRRVREALAALRRRIIKVRLDPHSRNQVLDTLEEEDVALGLKTISKR